MARKISYPGNKATSASGPKIAAIFPQHSFYWEFCLGSGGISRIKSPAPFSVGIEVNPDVIARFREHYSPEMLVINGDVFHYAEQAAHFPQDHLIYSDPPYPHGTRSQLNLYGQNEWSDDDHRKYLHQLRKATCSVVISSYPNPIYDEILHDWNTLTWTTSVHGRRSTEIIYFNFDLPAKRSDYKFIGANRSERQAIKRKANRWIKRLNELEPAVREFILDYMAGHVVRSDDGGQPKNVQSRHTCGIQIP